MENNKKAFTLAEIMAVLTILGVVAAITFSITYKNMERTQTLTRLKIAYSNLSNAIEAEEVYSGPSTTWTNNYKLTYTDRQGQKQNAQGCSTNFARESYELAERFVNTYLAPNLQITRTCRYGDDSTKCFASWNGNINGLYINEEGDQPSCYNSARDAYMFMTKDGMSYAVAYDNMYHDGYKNFKISVDINGPNKGKSIFGKDVFVFQVNSNGFQPYKDFCDYANLNSGAQYTGGGRIGCANMLISNGWKYPDNYPVDFRRN